MHIHQCLRFPVSKITGFSSWPTVSEGGPFHLHHFILMWEALKTIMLLMLSSTPLNLFFYLHNGCLVYLAYISNHLTNLILHYSYLYSKSVGNVNNQQPNPAFILHLLYIWQTTYTYDDSKASHNRSFAVEVDLAVKKPSQRRLQLLHMSHQS